MLDVEFDDNKFSLLADTLETAPELIHEGVVLALTVSGMKIAGTAARSGYAPRKTGELARSISYNLEERPGDVAVHIGSNKPYARIHEFGGDAGRGHAVHIVGKFYLTRAFADNRDYVSNAIRRYATVKAIMK